jgi:hypothetical protein
VREGREAGQREDAFVADIRVGVVETHTRRKKSRFGCDLPFSREIEKLDRRVSATSPRESDGSDALGIDSSRAATRTYPLAFFYPP